MNLTRVFAALCLAAASAFAGVGQPIQSSPIAISDDSKRLVVCNPDNDSITVFDASFAPPRKLATIKTGDEPSSVALLRNGEIAYVANALSGTVTPVDLLRRRALRPIQVGGEPSAVALTPNSSRLVVANATNNTLVVVDIQADPPVVIGQPYDLSAFGTSPRALAITNDGDADDADEIVFVALFYAQLRAGKTFVQEGEDDQREGRVVAFDTAGFQLLGNPNPIRLAPIANAGFNSNGRLAPGPSQVPAVASTNPQTFTTPTGAYPNQLAAIAIHPTSGRALVAGTGASPNGPLRFSHNVQGLISVFDVASRGEVTAAQTDATLRRTAPLNLNQGINLSTTPAPRLFMSNPVAMAWRPNGADAWVAIQNSNLLVRLTADAQTIPTIGAPLVAGPSQIVRVDLENPGNDLPAGKAPRGIAINSAGTRAYVSNFITRNVTVVDITNGAAPAVLSVLRSAALPRASSREGIAQLGAELFFTGRGPEDRMSSESWGGCIVCHPGGRSDNVTWMFDGGPRQTIALDGTFSKARHGFEQRILNWSAVRDENQDFELNTRNVFGGRGLIDDDRLFYPIGGVSGSPSAPTGQTQIESFNQATGVVSADSFFKPGKLLPELAADRRDFAIVQLTDERIFIIGGRTGAANSGAGDLVRDARTVLEFNARTNRLIPRGRTGFTPRHSLGAGVVQTAKGPRIYLIGGYESTDPATAPSALVQEFNPATNRWRTIASLPTAVAQFGTAVAGGANTAEPLQLIHVVSGNTSAENVQSPNLSSAVQRFEADPVGPGAWQSFIPAGLIPRRNHGVAALLRGTSSRIFLVGGFNTAGAVQADVQEYLAQNVAIVATPHTGMPAGRAQFGIAASATTNQLYVIGGVDDSGVDQTTVFEYTIATNGMIAGPAGTPSGTWVTRANLSVARRQLGVASVIPVANFLPTQNFGRDRRQDAIEEWVARKVRSARGVGDPASATVQSGRALFGQDGLVVAGQSCATCHGGPRWSRSVVDFATPPSPEVDLGLGDERVIGAELRQTLTQNPAFPGAGSFPGVLLNVGTFTLGGGRTNELRFNGADISQAVAPLGANGFNIPSLLSVHETAPYFYNGLAQTLAEVLDGSRDGNGGTRVHFVSNSSQRADLIAFLRLIDKTTPIFP